MPMAWRAPFDDAADRVRPWGGARKMFGISLALALIVIAIIVVLVIFLYYFPLALWIRTIAAGVPLSIGALIRMRVIGVPAGLIVANLVRARKAGVPVTVDQQI